MARLSGLAGGLGQVAEAPEPAAQAAADAGPGAGAGEDRGGGGQANGAAGAGTRPCLAARPAARAVHSERERAARERTPPDLHRRRRPMRRRHDHLRHSGSWCAAAGLATLRCPATRSGCAGRRGARQGRTPAISTDQACAAGHRETRPARGARSWSVGQPHGSCSPGHLSEVETHPES